MDFFDFYVKLVEKKKSVKLKGKVQRSLSEISSTRKVEMISL